MSVLIGVLSPGKMGKNKQKGKKQTNVFQVANKHLKSKNKAKAVTTTLKHVRSVSSLTPGFVFFVVCCVFVFLHMHYVFCLVRGVCCARSNVIFVVSQINVVKKEKVESLNQIFTQVQRDVKSISKSVAPEPKKQTQVKEEMMDS